MGGVNGLNEIVWGFFFAVLLIGILVYAVFWILYGISHMKLLRMVGYANPWMAWIPFACWYALADALPGDSVGIVGIHIAKKVFKLWWVSKFITPLIPAAGSFIQAVFNVTCRGRCYAILFATTDGKEPQDTTALGYIAGGFPIIAVFKYLFRKN